MDSTTARLLRLFKLYPDYFEYYLSMYYPFSREDIRKYKQKLNWKDLSCNIYIDWDEELLLEFEELWDWGEITLTIFGLKGLSNPSMVKKYLDKGLLVEALLDINDNIEWSKDMVFEYGYQNCFINSKISSFFRWDFDKVNEVMSEMKKIEGVEESSFENLSCHVDIEWSDEIIDEYIDQINFSNEGRYRYTINEGKYPWQYKYDIKVTTQAKELEEIISLIERYGDKLIPPCDEKDNLFFVYRNKDYFLFNNPQGKGIDFTFNTEEKRKILKDSVYLYFSEEEEILYTPIQEYLDSKKKQINS